MTPAERPQREEDLAWDREQRRHQPPACVGPKRAWALWRERRQQEAIEVGDYPEPDGARYDRDWGDL